MAHDEHGCLTMAPENKAPEAEKRDGAPEDALEDLFADLRWPEGVCCPSCGAGGVYRLSLASTRRRRYKCRVCRQQFSVTKGTILEGSKLQLHHWVRALRKLCERPEGMTVAQLHKDLGISYRAAQNLFDRLDYAARRQPLAALIRDRFRR
ncbi:MAG: transposase [Rhodobacterales bacterium]|nr:transposase [Rhodobacterales bacterium]